MKNEEFARFDSAVKKLVDVSHETLKKREADWKKQREQKRKKRERQKANEQRD